MDPLSATSGILTIVVAYQDVLSKAKALISTAQPELFAELEIYGEILSEISNIALQSTELPTSAQMCMRLCQDRIDQVYKQISEEEKKPIKRIWHDHGGLKAELESMRSSIVLLRDIVME
jgi:neutral trehalase